MDDNLSSHDAASIASTLQVILTEMRGGFDGLNTRMDRLEARMDALEARIDRLEARIDRLEARMDSFEAKLVQLRNDTAEMWREIGQRIDDRSDELRRDMARFRADTRSDLSQMNQLWRGELNFEAQNLHERIGALEKRLAIVERRVGPQTTE
jgi:chromosome segregation ATPase